jgi:hypothetical protein
VCHTLAFAPFTLKSRLSQAKRRIYGNSNIAEFKNIYLKKKPSKTNQNP